MLGRPALIANRHMLPGDSQWLFKKKTFQNNKIGPGSVPWYIRASICRWNPSFHSSRAPNQPPPGSFPTPMASSHAAALLLSQVRQVAASSSASPWPADDGRLLWARSTPAAASPSTSSTPTCLLHPDVAASALHPAAATRALHPTPPPCRRPAPPRRSTDLLDLA
jgi:hypothetical protein